MRKLSVFNFITLNGYFKGPNGDISWHKEGAGEEEKAFAEGGAASDGILLFGRVTYEMMASYWPTPMGLKDSPKVAEGMNKSEKIVVSRTLKKADWNNTSIISDNIADEITKLKKSGKKNITVLGSGNLVTYLEEHNLIDSYQFMLDPVVIGEGTSIFKGIRNAPKLKLVNSQAFKNGVVILSYESVKK